LGSEAAEGCDVKVQSVIAARYFPILVGCFVLLALLLFFWLSNALFPEHATGLVGWSPLYITGMALTHSTIPAFLLATLIYSDRRTRESLDQLVNAGRVNQEAAMSVGAGGSGLGLAKNFAATLLGLYLGAVQISWQPVLGGFGEPGGAQAASLAIGNIATWLVVVHVSLRRILVSIDFRRLGMADTEVDLFRLDTLLPFGRVATLHLMIVAMALSCSAFQSLDAELRWENYSAALAAAVPAGLVLVLLPMLGIRRNVRLAKDRALAKLDEAIDHASRDLEPDALRYLGDLLQQRKSIEHAREWPLDTTAFSRIAIYFVIPPVAWVGGALVEILVQSAL
jgi:hypothetical protein